LKKLCADLPFKAETQIRHSETGQEHSKFTNQGATAVKKNFEHDDTPVAELSIRFTYNQFGKEGLD
jgi:hypothetical protein